jgi:hypothetical protein
VPGVFDRAMFALRQAQRIGLETQMQTTVTKRNVRTLGRIAELAAAHDVKMWSLFFLIVTSPRHQRLACVLKNRARCRRSLTPASAALELGGTNYDGLRTFAMRASKTIWPSELHQVGPAALFGRKTILKLLDCPRIVIHTRNLQVVVG